MSAYITLVIPIAILFSTILICSRIGRARWKWLDKWLAISKRNRFIFIALGSGFTAVAGLLLAPLEWREIANGTITEADLNWLCGSAIAGGIGVWVQFAQVWHEDSWNEKLASLVTAVENAYKEVNSAQRIAYFTGWVNECFLKAIGHKRANLHRAPRLDHRRTPPSVLVNNYYTAVSPRIQMAVLVNVVYDIYDGMLPKLNPKPKLRVTYFHEKEGSLAEWHCWDGVCTQCLKTNQKDLKRKLKLSKSNTKHLAVAAAFSGKIEIVESTESIKSEDGVPFRFFDPDQRDRIKSIVAMPLGEPNERSYHRHVVCIDTDCAGFFKQSQKYQLELVKKNLEHRLLCELAMDSMLAPLVKKS